MILININNYNRIYNNKNNSIAFDYNIKDIEKSLERKILDLVEYEFKASTKLEKLKLKFDNIKIFFICINEEENELNIKNKKEIIVKEFTKEELSNMELSKDNPLSFEHKIFLKYKKGKIYASKVLARLSQKQNIVYLIEIPNEFKKVIFIKNLSKNVLNFKYKRGFKVGKNQYNTFELFVSKEKIDEVEIKDLNIELETIPNFIYKEVSAITPLKKDMNLSPREETASDQFENYSSNSLTFGHQRPSVKVEKEKKMKELIDINNLNPEELETLKRSSVGPMKQLNKRISANNLDYSNINNLNTNNNTNANNNINNINNNKNNNNVLEKKFQINYSSINSRTTSQKRMLPAPEFYIYNEANNKLDKYIDKMQIKYNNFETLLNQGKNKYEVLLKFLHEGSYKIKFSIVYYIRHKEIEDYIEYKEESILDYNVVKPFSSLNEILTNNYLKYDQSKFGTKQNFLDEEKEKRIYLTNSKIRMNFILFNKIDEDMQIKDIKIETKGDQSIKYINSYLYDLIHSYDLDNEEKNEILVIKKNSSYNIPFETEFSKSFNGSIGKISIIWNTNQMEKFENGKLNLLNEDEFEFPGIEVKPLDFEFNYKTETKENNEIKLDIKIKNISNKSKQITINIGNYEENNGNNFIILGKKIVVKKDKKKKKKQTFVSKSKPSKYNTIIIKN